MFRKISSAIVLYSILITVFGCASAPKRSSASDSTGGGGAHQDLLEKARSQNTPDAVEYAALDGEYRKHAFDAVLKRSRAFLKTYGKSEFLDEVYNLRALAFIGLKQHQNAAIVLKRLLE